MFIFIYIIVYSSNYYFKFSEILYEDRAFSEQKLAALVASKVYYHLGAFNDSVHYALCAGNLFDVNDRSEYVETIIGKFISYKKISKIIQSN